MYGEPLDELPWRQAAKVQDNVGGLFADSATSEFAAVPLRALLLESCGLKALPPALKTLGQDVQHKACVSTLPPADTVPELLVLYLAHNLLPTLADIQAGLSSFPNLMDLSLANNPSTTPTQTIEQDEPGYLSWIAQYSRTNMQNLLFLDGQPLQDALSGTHNPCSSRGRHDATMLGKAEDAFAIADLRAECTCRTGTACENP